MFLLFSHRLFAACSPQLLFCFSLSLDIYIYEICSLSLSLSLPWGLHKDSNRSAANIVAKVLEGPEGDLFWRLFQCALAEAVLCSEKFALLNFGAAIRRRELSYIYNKTKTGYVYIYILCNMYMLVIISEVG